MGPKGCLEAVTLLTDTTELGVSGTLKSSYFPSNKNISGANVCAN
jgi:hypothetical protein